MISDVEIGNGGIVRKEDQGPAATARALSARNLLNIVLPLVLIFSAESLFFAGYPIECIWVHGLNVFLCLLLLVLIGDDKGLFQAFSLVSLIRILGLGMPLFFDLTLYNFIPIYLAAIIGGLIVIGEGRPLRQQVRHIWETGMRAERKIVRDPMLALILVIVGLLAGYLLANVEYLIIQPEALIPELDLVNLLVLGFIMLFFVGFGEELLFRAILQNRIIGKMGELMVRTTAAMVGIIVASLVFAAMHSIYLSAEYLAYVFIVGLILGNAYHITKSLGFVSLIHGSINFFLFSFLPMGYLRLF